jgi:hypothetical protein
MGNGQSLARCDYGWFNELSLVSWGCFPQIGLVRP